MSGQSTRSPSNKVGSENPGNRGRGRPKGSVNKVTGAVKDMVLEALGNAGGVAYLQRQAEANPTAFLTLVGKVIPLQVQGSGNEGEIVHRIELVGVAPK